YSKGLYGSVMDYPAIPFRMPGEKQGQYWTTRPGPYDKWAIEFGYKPGLEGEALETVLSRSTQPELAFALDADDMRSPGKAIDPRAMINDMTSDPIGFSKDQIALIKAIQPNLRDRLVKKGESYDYLRGGFWLSFYRFQGAVEAVSRHIGGVYVDRAMAGQEGESMPLIPVAREDQKRAMATLADHLFAPDAFDSFAEVANYLLPQRRGWNHGNGTEDPKFHQSVLETQNKILDHLLHSRVLARLTDTTLYGNEYQVDQFLSDLTNAVFEADLTTTVNTFRQNLQLEYVDRLLNIVNGKDFDRVSQSMALNRLRWIEDNTTTRRSDSLQTKAHREHILYRIETGLDPKK
ncbi:MAG: zinc-dependent metalloprotease, partial [Verrucomicrobia bacterium]|nr:zinc-dependent metalloprotease [Verrucomicrobiota bacterium]